MIGKKFNPQMPEEDVQQDYRHMAALSKDNPIATIEHRVITPDGRKHWQQWTDHAFFNDDGEMIEMQSVGRNVTDRKRAEQALHESEARMAAILDNTTAVVYVKDLRGRYLLTNSRHQELFHVNKKDAVGKDDFELFPRQTALAFRANDQNPD